MPTLIVEDGTVVTDANTYISLVDADTYHDDRANEEWEFLDDDEKGSALIKATDYIDNTYRLRWKGFRRNVNQELTFPRADVVDEDGRCLSEDTIPERLRRATAEIALAIAPTESNDLAFLDPYAVDRDNAPIKRISEAVDVIKTEIEFMDGSQLSGGSFAQLSKVRFANGKAWLAGLVQSSAIGRVDRG